MKHCAGAHDRKTGSLWLTILLYVKTRLCVVLVLELQVLYCVLLSLVTISLILITDSGHLSRIIIKIVPTNNQTVSSVLSAGGRIRENRSIHTSCIKVLYITENYMNQFKHVELKLAFKKKSVLGGESRHIVSFQRDQIRFLAQLND